MQIFVLFFKTVKINNKNGQVDSIEFVSPFANGSTFLDEFINVPITKAQWMKIRDGLIFFYLFYSINSIIVIFSYRRGISTETSKNG